MQGRRRIRGCLPGAAGLLFETCESYAGQCLIGGPSSGPASCGTAAGANERLPVYGAVEDGGLTRLE